MTTRNTLLSTILLGFSLAACAAQPPGGSGPDGDPDNTNSDPANPGDPGDPGDPDPGNPGGGGTTAAQVVERISKTECDQAHTCKASFPTEFGAFADVFGNTPAECYPLNAEYWDADAVEAGIAAGKITFDQAAADACMAGTIAAPVCTTFWNEGPGIPEACWDAFAGTVAAGGACAIDFECSGELSCGDAGTCAAETGA